MKKVSILFLLLGMSCLFFIGCSQPRSGLKIDNNSSVIVFQGFVSESQGMSFQSSNRLSSSATALLRQYVDTGKREYTTYRVCDWFLWVDNQRVGVYLDPVDGSLGGLLVETKQSSRYMLLSNSDADLGKRLLNEVKKAVQ